MLGRRVELSVLGDFLDDFLNNDIVVNSDITWIQFNVEVASDRCELDCLLGRVL